MIPPMERDLGAPHGDAPGKAQLATICYMYDTLCINGNPPGAGGVSRLEA